MRERKKYIWLAALLFIFLVGCKSSFIGQKINKISFENNIIDKVAEGFLQFESFSSRLDIESEFSDDSNKFKGSLRIKRDSIVWISVNLITGLPVAKLQFEMDSFKLLDRINDKLYLGNYSDLEEKLKVKLNYEIIQSAFLNEISSCKNTENSVKRNATVNGDSVIIDCVISKNDTLEFVIKYFVNSIINKIEETNIINDSKQCLIKYSKFKEVENTLFPKQCDIELSDENRTIVLEIEFGKIRLNKKLKFPFKIKKNVEIMN